MPLVFGLGNPGSRYRRTRHNVGWRVVETLARRWGAPEDWAGPVYRSWRAERERRSVHLAVPLTFMNRSGEAMAAWLARQAAGRGELLVVSDDVYLPLGRLRLRSRGSSGGHRGLASLEAALAGGDWARLRLGVGAAEDSAVLREHVLEEFGPEEEPGAEEMITRAADAVECWLDFGLRAAMVRFNRRPGKEVHEP